MLATLLALSLASASASRCDDGDLAADTTCVDCTGDFAEHRVRPPFRDTSHFFFLLITLARAAGMRRADPTRAYERTNASHSLVPRPPKLTGARITQPSQCLNGGACSTGAAHEKPDRSCQCLEDFTGPQCALRITRCADGAGFFCANGGTCASSGCNCPLGYSGHRCDISDVIETCDSPALEGEVCLHGGICHGDNPDRPCRCTYNHAGKNCEIENVVKCDDDGEGIAGTTACVTRRTRGACARLGSRARRAAR